MLNSKCHITSHHFTSEQLTLFLLCSVCFASYNIQRTSSAPAAQNNTLRTHNLPKQTYELEKKTYYSYLQLLNTLYVCTVQSCTGSVQYMSRVYSTHRARSPLCTVTKNAAAKTEYHHFAIEFLSEDFLLVGNSLIFYRLLCCSRH